LIFLSRVKDRSLGLAVAWAVVVASGILFLEAYAARPGAQGALAEDWPVASPVARDHRRPTLLIFLHPHCPCSQASLAELAAILDRCRDRVAIHAILLSTPVLDRWSASENERGLAALPGVHVDRDPGGQAVRRFGVATSGHVLLYDRRGRLIFSGGITAARGHVGDNLGKAAVLDAILHEVIGHKTSPVFGCPLMTPGSNASAESGP
jgi:hypothetical protein